MASLMVALRGSKTNGFTARKAIPADVRNEYARLYRVAWEEKLRIAAGTSLHDAKAQCAEWISEIENRIATLRAVAAGDGQPLNKRNAFALAGKWYGWFLAQHEDDDRPSRHWEKMADHLVWDVIHPLAPSEYHQDARADTEWEWKARPEVRNKVRPVIAEMARTASFLVGEGMILTPEATNLFLDSVEENLLPAFARLDQLSRGDYTADELPKTFPEFVESHGSTKEKIGCWTLFEKWELAVQPASSTVLRWTTVFRTARDRFPDAGLISAADAKAWMNGLPNTSRSAHTVATVWKAALKTVFTWALGEGLVKANPFKDVKITVPKKTQERETKSFSSSESDVILRAALAYTDPKSIDERARRWVPWICAYTGARAGEITQLRGADIEKRGENYFAKLSPSAGKMKTRKARTIPLHEHLIAQGFVAFVEESGTGPLFYRSPSRNAAGRDRLKPKQSPAERTRGRLGSWVRSLGISDPEVSPNHAWRHTFKAQAARSGIEERYSDAITGHAPTTVGRSYGQPTPEDLANAMRKFPRYSLASLTVAGAAGVGPLNEVYTGSK